MHNCLQLFTKYEVWHPVLQYIVPSWVQTESFRLFSPAFPRFRHRMHIAVTLQLQTALNLMWQTDITYSVWDCIIINLWCVRHTDDVCTGTGFLCATLSFSDCLLNFHTKFHSGSLIFIFHARQLGHTARSDNFTMFVERKRLNLLGDARVVFHSFKFHACLFC